MTHHLPLAAADLAYLNSRASLPALAQIAVRTAVVLTRWSQRHRTRKQLRHLSDQQLHDIALTREQAWRQSSLPFWRP